jgi:hypothetical protein
MVPRIARVPEKEHHIAPHRAWTALKEAVEFSSLERDHILQCVQCLRLFVGCLHSKTFGAVLKDLEDQAA